MEYPILFSAPMVRAILDGRKTQTRRVVKPQPPTVESVVELSGSSFSIFNDTLAPAKAWHVAGPVWAVRDLMGCEPHWLCPFGKPGDTLWVREAWRLGESNINGVTVAKYEECDEERYWRVPSPYELAALSSRHNGVRPSIHMPRWASRISLLVKAVRVERLQEISYADISAEGIELQGTHVACMNAEQEAMCGAFATLWDSINAKKHPWASNPWVWVVEFERVKGGA